MKILSGPNESKKVTMPARKPVSSDATVTTVVIPITMPRMVRPERNRCVQTADMAMVKFSLGEMFTFCLRYSALSASLCPQSYDRIELRRFRCRIPSADDTDGTGNEHGQKHVNGRDPQGHAESRRQYSRQPGPDADPDGTAREGHQDRLDQDLHHNVGAA